VIVWLYLLFVCRLWGEQGRPLPLVNYSSCSDRSEQNVVKIHTHANYGGCRPPMAAMVTHSQRQGIQRSANMLLNRSTLLKLEKIYIYYYYFYYYVHNELMMMMWLQATMPTATYGPSAAVPMQ
jgi:hypothetical protein